MIHRKSLVIFVFGSCIYFIFYCNPVSENISGNAGILWNSLHSSKPFMSNVFHGTDYRFPAGSCDEVQCHGYLLTGGNSGAPSCYVCHNDQWTIFQTTHTLKVSEYYHHTAVDGVYDINNSTVWFMECKACHGSNLDGVGGTASYSCKVCHSGFSTSIPPPGHRIDHGSSWHHYNVGSPASLNCAGTACHGTGGTSGAAGPGCSNCHIGTAHSSRPFMSDVYHGANYRFPAGSCDGDLCHGSLLSGGNTGAPSCYVCHTDQWSIFQTTHTLNVSGIYHHTGVDSGYDTGSNATWFSGCKSCHGTNLDGSGGSAVYTCKVCHSGFVGLIPPPGHRSNREGAFHSGSGSCSGNACHGNNGESGGTAATSFTGLAGHGPACSQCHD